MQKPTDNPTPANDAAAASAQAEAAEIKRRAIKKALALLAVVVALGVISSLPPVRQFIGENMPRLKQFIQDCGPWAPVVFAVAVAALVAVGVPRLAFHFLGGALFAFWAGLLWSYLGTMLGYAVVFLTVRQLGVRELVLRKHPAWQALAGKLKHNTVPAVILFRQIPMPGIVTNAVLGLSPIRRREFFLGTSIGLFPEAIPMVLLGAGLRKEQLGMTVVYLFGAVGVFIVGWILWGIYTRRAAAGEAALDSQP